MLRTRHRFVRYEEGEDGVEVEFETPEGPRRLRAALLIGCDGGQSAVREQLIGDGPPQYLGGVGWGSGPQCMGNFVTFLRRWGDGLGRGPGHAGRVYTEALTESTGACLLQQQ